MSKNVGKNIKMMTYGPLPMSNRSLARPECSRRDDRVDLSERGDNYLNGLTIFPGRDGGTGPLGNAIVSLSPRVAFLPLLVRKDEQDLGRKTRGGTCPRGPVEGVSRQIAILVPPCLC